MMNQLKDEFAKMLSTQNEQHQQQIAQSEVNFLGHYSLNSWAITNLIYKLVKIPKADGKVERCPIADKGDDNQWSK
jgi:hypothetical protein